MSTDRVVAEFILRQAQDIVNAFSEESLRNDGNTVEVESCLVTENEGPQSLDDIKHTGWLPLPCATTVRNHILHFGKLPGIWNMALKEPEEDKIIFSRKNFSVFRVVPIFY